MAGYMKGEPMNRALMLGFGLLFCFALPGSTDADPPEDEKDLAMCGIGVEGPPRGAKQSDGHSESRQPERACARLLASRGRLVGDRHGKPLFLSPQVARTDPRDEPHCRIPRPRGESQRHICSAHLRGFFPIAPLPTRILVHALQRLEAN